MPGFWKTEEKKVKSKCDAIAQKVEFFVTERNMQSCSGSFFVLLRYLLENVRAL